MALTKKQKNGLFRGVIVTAITVILIICIGYVLTLRKDESYFNIKGLYDAEDINVLFVGNSHAIVGLHSVQFDEITGAQSYNIATTSQTVQSAELLIKEALDTHDNIDVIFIETFSMIYPTPADSGYSRSMDSDTTVYRSVNGVTTKFTGMIMQPGIRRKFDAFLPLFKYHANWKKPEMWQTRFLLPTPYEENYSSYLENHENGSRYSPYIMTEERYADFEDYYYDFNVNPAMAANAKHWDAIIEMCREHDTEVVFITIPWLPIFVEHTNYESINTAFSDYFEEKGVTYIDFNMMDLALEYTDFSGEIVSPNQHLNSEGATKVTSCLAEWFNSEYSQGE
ncbi:MAG: hypothetical protein AB1Z19_00720 [Eubacteriales bacterium]